MFSEANDVGVWLSVCVPIMSYSREKIFSLKFEFPSSTVVCSIFQFERHCCRGASKPMPADDGSSFPGSGSILPLAIPSIQTCTSNDISEQRDRGFEGWVVPMAATTARVAAWPLLSMKIRSSLANSLSVKLAVPCSNSLKKLSALCFDLSFSDIEIFFFNTFTSAHMLAVVSFGVEGSGL